MKPRCSVERIVCSIGGSVISPPGGIAVAWLDGLVRLLQGRKERFLLIAGGGAPCRQYRDALLKLGVAQDDRLDWMGIAATRLNAELLRQLLDAPEVIMDPTAPLSDARILIGGGWKPGNSSDYIAALLATNRVINISNITHVYDKDPSLHADARPIDVLTWTQFRSMIGGSWKPGMHVPFDPAAADHCQQHGIEVDIIGPDLENFNLLLDNAKFVGTRIT